MLLVRTAQRIGYWILEYLSETELYYSQEIQSSRIIIAGAEKDHIIKVMRHKKGNLINVTDGKGKIYSAEIVEIQNDFIAASAVKTYSYENPFVNYFLCIPKLKNPERFEFALEKSTELGITNFIIYSAVNGIKKSDKKERWEKILISAMKQSLRSFKPSVEYIDSINEINKRPGIKIIFEQDAIEYFNVLQLKNTCNYYFIFGPEGGLDKEEKKAVTESETYRIAPNRLRTETAIIKAVSLLTS